MTDVPVRAELLVEETHDLRGQVTGYKVVTPEDDVIAWGRSKPEAWRAARRRVSAWHRALTERGH